MESELLLASPVLNDPCSRVPGPNWCAPSLAFLGLRTQKDLLTKGQNGEVCMKAVTPA